MPARKIRPEVLRPFLLVIAMLVALFVLQFLRPVPPDLRPATQPAPASTRAAPPETRPAP